MATQGIKLDDATSARLKAVAEQKDRSPHWLMKTAIEEYLEREEKYERERAEDEARWQAYLTTGKAFTMEDVEPWLKDLAAGKTEVLHKWRT